MHAAEKEAVEYDFHFRKLKAQHADIVWGGVPYRAGKQHPAASEERHQKDQRTG